MLGSNFRSKNKLCNRWTDLSAEEIRKRVMVIELDWIELNRMGWDV